MDLSQFGPMLRRGLTNLSWSRLGPPATNETERNIWFLYVEIFWASLLSAAGSFNSAFAVRLGASNQMIGWLSSIPSLIAVVMLIPAARFLESKSQRAPWIWGSLFIARLGYLLVALLPWLVAPAYQAPALVWLLVAITAPSTFFSAGWNPLLADVVPERDRARVFAGRNIVSSAAIAVLTLVAGWWLQAAGKISWAPFPVNYQVMYLVGFAGAAISSLCLLWIKVPQSKVVARSLKPRTARFSLAPLRSIWAENRDFARIILNTLFFDLGAWLVGPLYILFFVRELGATDGWIGLHTTLAHVGVIVGFILWRRWIRRLGYSRTLLLTVPLGASYAFLVSLVPNLSAILVWGMLINLINPGINLSHFNILLKLCPEERKASYIAFYSSIMNAGAFVAPMIGVALAEWWGIRTVLLIGGAIRLLGAASFYLFRIHVTESDIG